MAASPSSQRPAASPAASPVPSLSRTACGSPSSPGQRSPIGSPSYSRMQAATPTRVGVESPELHINDHGPVTLFSSLMAGWMGSVSMGTSIGYSLPAGQSLIHARSNITRSGDQQLFWFDSLLPLAAVFGSMWGCCLAFWLGRRWAMAIGSLGSLCAWLVLGCTSINTWNLYTTRFLVGVATGVVSLIAPAYIAEIATAKDRGKQCGTVHTGIAAGVLYTYLVGRFTDWSMLALWCALPSALSAILAVWAVESPRWLMEQGKHDEAQVALRRLRFITSQADGELQAIEVIYIKSPTPVSHYILAVMIIVVQQFSGVNMIMHYATGPLLTTFTSTSRDFYIILASVQLVTTALASMLLDMCGRVKPLAVSVTICTCSMVALGSILAAFSNADGNVESALGLDFTNTCKVVFAIGYSLGLGPATWVLVVELAPLRGRGFDFCTVCIFHWVSALAVISLVSAFGLSTSSLAVLAVVAGGSTLAGGVAAFFILPDTSCVSLETILLEGRKNRPKKPTAPLEFASSTVQPQKEEQKNEQMQRKVAALFGGSSTTQLQKYEQDDEWNQSKAAAFGHASIHPMPAVRTSKRTLHTWSHEEPKSSRAHNSRNDANGEEPKKGATSPNN